PTSGVPSPHLELPQDWPSTTNVLECKPQLDPNPSRDSSEDKHSLQWASGRRPPYSGGTPNDPSREADPTYERTGGVSLAGQRDRNPSQEHARAQYRSSCS